MRGTRDLCRLASRVEIRRISCAQPNSLSFPGQLSAVTLSPPSWTTRNTSRHMNLGSQNGPLISTRCFSDHAVPRTFKAWTDEKRSLSSRVQALMDVPRIHPAEIATRDSGLNELLVKCCKAQTLEGMQLATEIMERVLVEKNRLLEEDIKLFVPMHLWEKVMFGWAKIARTQSSALNRMRGLMDIIIDEAQKDANLARGMDSGQGPLPSEPSIGVFNTFLQGLEQAAGQSSGAALIAEDTVLAMKEFSSNRGWQTKPNTRSYTYVISAHANSWHARSGENALAVLRFVQSEHEAEKKAYSEEYGKAYDEWEIGSSLPKIVTADATMYTVVMNSIIQSKSDPDLVIQVLDEAVRTGVADRIHYNVAIKALAKKIENTKNPGRRLQIAEQAESLLNKGLQCPESPKVSALSSYDACLDVWSRSFISEMGPRSEALLHQMLSDGQPPGASSFHRVIRAWSKSAKFHGSDAVNRVEATLEVQRNLAEESNGRVEYPDFQAYALAILAYTGQGPESTKKAATLLDTMVAESHRQHVSTSAGNPCAPFAALLSVTASAPKISVTSDESQLWSSENDVVDPYELATRVYDQVVNNVYQMEDLKADHHFYAAFLRTLIAHGNATAVDFETTASRVWEQATESGEVSRLVLAEATKIPLLAVQFPGKAHRTTDLPRFWWRNVEPRWR